MAELFFKLYGIEAIEAVKESIIISDNYGRILRANNAACIMYEYTSEEFKKVNMFSLHTQDFKSSPNAYHNLVKNLNEGQVWKGECYNQRSSGEIYWERVTISPICDANGNVAYFFRISVDITEQRSLLEKLEKEHSNLEQILKLSDNGICVTDLSGKILTVNSVFAKMCNLNQSELIGQNACKLFPTPYCNTGNCCLVKISRGQSKIEFHNQFVDKIAGKKKYYSITVRPFRDMNGEWIGLVKYFRNIELQETMRRDLMLAGKIQKNFIPQIEDDKKVIFETVYKPYHHVSGDIIDFGWNSQKTVLYGYVVDVMGHGIGTALQTSALRVLFRQTFNDEMPPGKKLSWINRQSGPYFAEDFFAAAIYFEFDFNAKILRYSAAGINHFLVSTAAHKGVVSIPGSLIGIGPTLYFDEGQINFESGDYFCFMSDGLLDILEPTQLSLDGNFAEFAGFMRSKADSPTVKDDISAICICIR